MTKCQKNPRYYILFVSCNCGFYNLKIEHKNGEIQLMYLPKNILPDFFNLTFNQAFDIGFSDSVDHNTTAETFFEPPFFTRKHGHRQRLGFRICQEPFNLFDATIHSRITLCHNTYLHNVMSDVFYAKSKYYYTTKNNLCK